MQGVMGHRVGRDEKRVRDRWEWMGGGRKCTQRGLKAWQGKKDWLNASEYLKMITLRGNEVPDGGRENQVKLGKVMV